MKKIYTLICVFAVSLTAISQVINNDVLINPIQKHNNQVALDNLVEQTVNSSFNSTSTLIWESDFSDPNDWVIDNQGGGGGAFGWTIDATVDSWYYGGANPPISINSTSEEILEVSNGNPTGAGTQLLNVTYNLTTAQPIDILGSIDQQMRYFHLKSLVQDLMMCKLCKLVQMVLISQLLQII